MVVYKDNGDFKILSCPKNIFPPTDFHTATLVGEYIYIIGNLGYIEQRINQETPVYKLSFSLTLQIKIFWSLMLRTN